MNRVLILFMLAASACAHSGATDAQLQFERELLCPVARVTVRPRPELRIHHFACMKQPDWELAIAEGRPWASSAESAWVRHGGATSLDCRAPLPVLAGDRARLAVWQALRNSEFQHLDRAVGTLFSEEDSAIYELKGCEKRRFYECDVDSCGSLGEQEPSVDVDRAYTSKSATLLDPFDASVATRVSAAFQKRFVCPVEQINNRERTDLALHDFACAAPSSDWVRRAGFGDRPWGSRSELPELCARRPPDEIARDPERLALWQRESGVPFGPLDTSYSPIFEVSGCGEHHFFTCSRGRHEWINCDGPLMLDLGSEPPGREAISSPPPAAL